MPGLPLRALAACVVLGTSLSGCSDGAASEKSAFPQEIACGPATVVAILPELLIEASGIARDPRRDDLFWLPNDGGRDALLFGVDTTGAVLVTARIADISNRDMEDLTIGRCGSDWCIYLGDIGDNRSRRESVRVHVIPLPTLPDPEHVAAARIGGFDQELKALASWELEYPDGPRDAEGLLVDDSRGELLVISKGRRNEGVVLYSIDVAGFDQGDGEIRTLNRVGRLAIPVGGSTSQLVTAADLSPDGKMLAVRSYASLHLLPWSGAARQDTALVPYSALLFLAFEPQGEGVTWSADGEVLYLASEGRNGRPPQLSRILCRSD